MRCEKCGGAGSYMYDENHGKPCEACCDHSEGWFLLRIHYGESNGKYACKKGCGETRWPEEIGIASPQFQPTQEEE